MPTEEELGRTRTIATDLRKTAVWTSMGVAVLMLIGKMGAYYVTGSAAILADAAESVIHIAATGAVALSLLYSLHPADRTHPYGHGKIAYFSAGFEGAMILSAAMVILYLASKALIQGQELHRLGLGVLVIAGLAAVNLCLGLFLIHVGKKHNAIILVANGKHVLTDVWTSLGVVVGITIVWATGIAWLDPIVAMAVGLNILATAVMLIRRSYQGLLDTADPEDTQRLLGCLQNAVDDHTIAGFHQLRHRCSNDIMWVEVHVSLSDDMPNAEAHRRVTSVERDIYDLFAKFTVHTTTHIEPITHEQAHPEGHESLSAPFECDEAVGEAAAENEESGGST